MASDAPRLPLGRLLLSADVQFAVALVCMLFMMFLPLPALLLDVLLTLSITLGLMSVLIAIYIKDPLEFSTFPTFLLLVTLFRLSLNVATTRNILLWGAGGQVSQVIDTFGKFVVGGNYLVGVVIFLILVIINFVVITKGAGRVAEVGARFTLDAMPGKQMAIDADLNAGIIDREAAIARRRKIEREADFYGAMDGASKFVRGDAIAGILITGINIVVGLAVGVIQHKLSFAQAAQIYTLLTVGDGLVSQIPSIVISVAAGIVVTRASGDSNLSDQLANQFVMQPTALRVCAALIFGIGLLPGLPLVLFAAIAALAGWGAQAAEKTLLQRKVAADAAARSENKEKTGGEPIETLLHVDTLTLEVGVSLIPLVDPEQSGEILERIVSARKQFVQEMGVIVPMVVVKDNIQIGRSDYRILLHGEEVGAGSLMADYELAMASDSDVEAIDGYPTREPAYGLEAWWIRPEAREEASIKGYTVVNCATVIVTHLSKVISEYAGDLLGRQEVSSLIDRIKERCPKLVDEVLSSDNIGLGGLVKVLQLLLAEAVSIRNLTTILETVADHGRQSPHPEHVLRQVRRALARTITGKFVGSSKKLQVVTLERSLEERLNSAVVVSESQTTALQIDPQLANRLLEAIAAALTKFERVGAPPVLLCGSTLRWDLSKLVRRFIPGISVLSFEEVPPQIEAVHLDTVHLST